MSFSRVGTIRGSYGGRTRASVAESLAGASPTSLADDGSEQDGDSEDNAAVEKALIMPVPLAGEYSKHRAGAKVMVQEGSGSGNPSLMPASPSSHAAGVEAFGKRDDAVEKGLIEFVQLSDEYWKGKSDGRVAEEEEAASEASFTCQPHIAADAAEAITAHSEQDDDGEKLENMLIMLVQLAVKLQEHYESDGGGGGRKRPRGSTHFASPPLQQRPLRHTLSMMRVMTTTWSCFWSLL